MDYQRAKVNLFFSFISFIASVFLLGLFLFQVNTLCDHGILDRYPIISSSIVFILKTTAFFSLLFMIVSFFVNIYILIKKKSGIKSRPHNVEKIKININNKVIKIFFLLLMSLFVLVIFVLVLGSCGGTP